MPWSETVCEIGNAVGLATWSVELLTVVCIILIYYNKIELLIIYAHMTHAMAWVGSRARGR